MNWRTLLALGLWVVLLSSARAEEKVCPKINLTVAVSEELVCVGNQLTIVASDNEIEGNYNGMTSFPDKQWTWKIDGITADQQEGAVSTATITPQSSGNGTIHFSLVCTSSPGAEDCDDTFTAVGGFHVVEAQLGMDCNRNGDPDEGDEALEESVGGLIGVNHDDDNTNGIPDVADTGVVANENDLIAIYLNPDPAVDSGSLTLEAVSGGDKIRVWKNATKEGVPVKLPMTWHPGHGTIPKVRYVEGIKASDSPKDVQLRLTYKLDSGEHTDTNFLTVIKVEMAMDGNRDNNIDFDDSGDAKYLFWVNNDHDECTCLQTEFIWVEDDLRGRPDWDNDYVGFKSGIGSACRRDLEDFTRLHIRVDDNTANLPGITYWLKFENSTANSPSANIFEAMYENLDYLKVGSVADQQIQKTRLITVAASEVQLTNRYIKTGNQRSPFILEGRSEGKGDLTLIVKIDGREVFKKSVTLELRPIEKFYQLFQVGMVGQYSTDCSGEYNADFTSSDDYLLFVHGFNVNAIDKEYWPGTIFKRLWWQGYKGHFGFFDWPCAMLELTDMQCYDKSEFVSWRCGVALKHRLDTLNSGQHAGKVRLLAHSQGNIISGQALRLAVSTVVHTYIASQAAISGDCYQGGLIEYFTDYTTPNVRANYPGTPGIPYLTGLATKAQNCFNYYNAVDYALQASWLFSWEDNNQRRPDASYWYEGPTNTYDVYAAPTPSRFYYNDITVLFDDRDLVFHGDRDKFEIFSFDAEARARALGTQPAMDNFSSFNLAVLGYGSEHYSHSRQFRSNIIDEWPYWARVMLNCSF